MFAMKKDKTDRFPSAALTRKQRQTALCIKKSMKQRK
jgi:hypothetical protein